MRRLDQAWMACGVAAGLLAAGAQVRAQQPAAGAEGAAAAPKAQAAAPVAANPAGAAAQKVQKGGGGQRRKGKFKRDSEVVPLPPQYAHWIVRLQPSDDLVKMEPGPAKDSILQCMRPLMAEYLRTATIGKIVTTWEQGRQTITWCYNNIQLQRFGSDSRVFISEFAASNGDVSGGLDMMGGDMTETLAEYPGFDWLREELLVGEVEAYGKICLYYRSARNEEELTNTRREAWLLKEGKWPIAERVGPFLRTFQHLSPPSAGSVPPMPADFVAALKKYCDDWGYPAPKL